MVFKVLATVRNHWKKTIFFSGLITYGCQFGYRYYCDFQLMRAYCDESKAYGRAPISPLTKNKHVTVILNPSANDGKSKKLFEKWSVPLLHLAGYKVSIVNTERAGQASDYMEIMSNTDAVLIAGGDGTVSEVITGMMRRSDRDEFTDTVALGLIPLGKQNSVLSELLSCNLNKKLVKAAIMKSTMALIQEHNRHCDVLEIESTEGKRPVYALSGLWFGSLRDAQEKCKKYWYLGGLKKYGGFISNAIRGKTESHSVQLEYLEPCSGCANCFVEEKVVTPVNTRWWHSFIKRPNVVQGRKLKPDFVNRSCGDLHHDSFETISFRIHVLPWKNFSSDNPAFVITKGSEDNRRSTFIKEGSKLARGLLEQVDKYQYARQATVGPPPDNENLWYFIDNEAFEARDAKFTLLSKRVRLCLPTSITS